MKTALTMSGTVTPFQGNGRKLGYPTANIVVALGAEDGVYFGRASLGSFAHHPAIIFIGTPTTMGDTERRVEAHLLDITDRDYYGQQLELELRHRHRSNLTFDSVSKLIAAMKADEVAARSWFKTQDK